MTSSTIENLLDAWEESYERGIDLPIDTLCSEHPELRSELEPRIHALRSVAWMDDATQNIGQSITRVSSLPRHFDRTAHFSRETEKELPESSLTCAEFVAAIIGTALLSESELTTYMEAHADRTCTEDSAKQLGQRLVSIGKLTSWQARVLLEQRDEPLRIDRYVVLDALGCGGMGVVYQAIHTSLNRMVALKLPPQHAVNSRDKVQRLRREARAAAKLSHPNIVTMFDAAETDGRHFLAMEYIDGPNLAQFVQQNGPLPVSQAAALVGQAAAGLQHAHEQGIVHRDVKPSNLLLAPDGRVKVTDLGLATVESALASEAFDQNLTAEGTFVGTVAYASPEQSFESGSLDSRSDIYSLGATLFFLLTGRPPFQESTGLKTLFAHREQAPPSLQEIDNSIPSDLEAICHRMLAKQPEERFQSMAEVTTALQVLKLSSAGRSRMAPAANAADVDTASVGAALQPTDAHSVAAQPAALTPAERRRSVRTIALRGVAAAAIVLAIIIRITDRSGQTTSVSISPGDSSLDRVSMTMTVPTRTVFQDSGMRLGRKIASSHVEAGDFDGDGDIDALISHQNAPNTVWLNDGDGNFVAGAELGDSDTRRFDMADLDGDGDPDAFMANYSQPGQPNRVWLNDGRGNFTDSGQLLGTSHSRDVALHDLDGDGDIDAWVVNKGEPNTIWFNDGHGTFSDSGQRLGTFDSRGLDAGDIDNDGDVDVIVANGGDDNCGEPNRVWLNDGHGNFQDSGQLLGDNWSLNVALGDLDGDGDLDAAVANTIGRPANTIWLNDGSGRFRDTWQTLGNFHSQNVALIDIDNDSDLDICESNVQSGLVWLNDGHAVFEDSFYFGGRSAMTTAFADFNGDGVLDAFEAAMGRVQDRVLFGAGPTPPAVGAVTVEVSGTDNFKENDDAAMETEAARRAPDTTEQPETSDTADNRVEEDFVAETQQACAERLQVPIADTNSIGMQLTLIPPGTFQMGLTAEQIAGILSIYQNRDDDTRQKIRHRLLPSVPQHQVVLSEPVYFATHPVTVGQFRAFTDATEYVTTAEARDAAAVQQQPNWTLPGFPQTDDHPVIYVSRADALAFCAWLSNKENQTYELPTEAQWEYACRAGTDTPWFYGQDRDTKWSAYALPTATNLGETLPVGTKLPNAWGIFDLYGHPLELVRDFWHPYPSSTQTAPESVTPASRMTVRGNPYYGSAWRGHTDDATLPGNAYTFRVVRSVPTAQ